MKIGEDHEQLTSICFSNMLLTLLDRMFCQLQKILYLLVTSFVGHPRTYFDFEVDVSIVEFILDS